jgi:SAM-dependent methyltransferase
MEPGEYALMDVAEDTMWWYRALHARLLDALRPVHGTVLDAGCGTGGLLAVLRQRRPDLATIGLDFDPSAARQAVHKAGEKRIVVGSINALPFADASFDAAIAADVLCHAAVEPMPALGELRRVLRPGGALVVNMPAYRWLLSAHDRRVHNVRRQTAGELHRLLTAAGFARPTVRYWNGLLLPVMVAQRKLRRRRPDAASDVAVFSPWLDRILHGVTALERRLPWRMAAGGSVMATAVRP